MKKLKIPESFMLPGIFAVQGNLKAVGELFGNCSILLPVQEDLVSWLQAESSGC
jgi:hypothetical protein